MLASRAHRLFISTGLASLLVITCVVMAGGQEQASDGPQAAGEQSQMADIAEALLGATTDAEGDVRLTAFIELESQPRSDAIVEAFRRGLDDESPQIRQLALSKFVEFEGTTEEVMQRLITSLADPQLVNVAQKLLFQIGEPAVPPLLSALERDELKPSVAQILAQIKLGTRRKEVIDALTALAKDGNRQVRMNAIKALGRIGRDVSGQAAAVNPRYLKYAQSVVGKYDANSDGSLSKDEWSSMRTDPSAADQNKDERITEEELAKWYSQRQ